jgi:hypothetical protein
MKLCGQEEAMALVFHYLSPFLMSFELYHIVLQLAASLIKIMSENVPHFKGLPAYIMLLIPMKYHHPLRN